MPNYYIEIFLERMPYAELHTREIEGVECECISLPLIPCNIFKKKKKVRMYFRMKETKRQYLMTHHIELATTDKRMEMIEAHGFEPLKFPIGWAGLDKMQEEPKFVKRKILSDVLNEATEDDGENEEED